MSKYNRKQVPSSTRHSSKQRGQNQANFTVSNNGSPDLVSKISSLPSNNRPKSVNI
jgi:hypothetical protein